MNLQTLIFQLLNGLVWGLILALITLGLTLIFGILSIINIAHAALYMLGAVLAWEVIQYTGSFWAAMVIAPLLVGLVSVAIERVVLCPISGNFVLSIRGSIFVAIVIGCVDGVFTTYFPASEARIMTLVLVSLILLLRPEGIFRARRETVI